jgi:uncharacterized membrane protein
VTQAKAIDRTDDTDEPVTRRRKMPILIAGGVLGAGLGGVIDAILFQQIFQWHHVLSSVVPPVDVPSLTTNVRADGLGALLAVCIALSGLAMLWSAVARPGIVLSTRSFLASLGAGWCAFNLVEGLLAHHVLGLHRMRYGPHGPGYDFAYLLISAALCVILVTIARSERPRTAGARRWWQSGREPSPELSSPDLRRTASRPVLVTPPPRM